MNRSAKMVMLALILSVIPARIWAQDYMSSHDTNETQQIQIRDYENGFLFNVFGIESVEERVQLASALATSDIWICNPTENPGELFIRPNSNNADIPIYAEFDYLRMTLREEYEEAASLPKEEFAEIFNSWAANISNDYYNFLVSDHLDRANHCMDAEPFCTSDVYDFPANNSGYSWSGPNYGCLGSSPTTKHSFWYYMRIGVAGNITIKLQASFDVDFALWGPFANETDPCPTQAGQTGMLTATCSSCPNNTSSNANYPYGNLHDCSFDAQHIEYAHVVNGQVGQYFILLITNYSGSSGNITFQKYAGDGETDCGIMPGVATNDGPYCVGETIQLNVNAQDGATYSWTGPGGFTSTQQNPTRPNCTMNMAGTYTCVTTVGSQTTSAFTEVVIYPQPTANFTFTTVCVGEATQFTSTSTTNPTGQQINSYLWNFGDGQTSTMSNPSHTYANPGTYQVTLTVACGNGHCTNETTKTVTVSALPTVSFEYTTVCQGSPTQFTGSATGGQNITNYQWNFGDGQTGTGQNTSHTYAQAGAYQVTLTASSPNGSCPGEVTQSVTVIALPDADAGADQTIPYGSTAQLSGSGGAGIFNFHWEPANMVANPNAQNTQTVVLTQDQTYTLTVTNPQGECTATDEVTIHISGSAMTVTANATPGSVCEGESTQLVANAGGGTGNFTYSWTPTTGLSNPNIYNPIATPAQTTTYTCTVGDGQTTQSVNVTVTVNYPEYEEEDHYICPDETYLWNGLTCSAEGDYDYHTTTAQGCEKTITLHLHHYPTFDETTITHTMCQGESYNFFGTIYTSSTQTSTTLQTIHGCDSIVRLDLTVWPENDIADHPVTLCPEQLPYYYDQDPNQIPLYEGLHVFHLEDIHGCDSTVFVDIEVSEYYMPPVQTEYVCYTTTPSFEWIIPEASTSFTFNEDGMYIDTLHTANCDGIFRLDLHFQQVPETIVEEVVTCDSYTWPRTNQTFTQSGEYYHSVSLYPFPCEQVYQLNLTINTQSLLPDVHISDSCDYARVPWFGQDTTFTVNTAFTFTGVTDEGCYREQTYYIENMKYTPNPKKIQCSDASAVVFGPPGADADTIAVVTNTEFFSFQYSFFVEEDNRECVWDQCTWDITKPSWTIEFDPTPQVSSNGKSYSRCTVYVADRQSDYVVLTATISNECGTKQRKFYLKSSFLDIDEDTLPNSSITIVPNPNSGKMHIDFENMQGRTSVKVFDMTGNQIDAFETTVSTSHHSYDYNMKRYAEGIYFFVFINENRMFTKKVVIIH